MKTPSRLHSHPMKCFRQWSRKGYSILASMSLTVKIGVLCLAYSLVNKPELLAQVDTVTTTVSEYEFEGVEITGRRSVTVQSSLLRIISIISKDEIEKSGLNSFADLLEYTSNVDIRQRGVLGVQSDISIRGSSYDHVMILLNGINVSSPQTGHLSLDLPVDPESIERIEILEGPAARSLGPGAFMGAINIITKKGDVPRLYLGQTLGDFGLMRTLFNSGFKTGIVSNFFSAARSSSDGYRHNTDHEIYNIYYRAAIEGQPVQLDLQAGYQNKQFGAGGFYSPRFPDQYEENSDWFGSLKVASGRRLKLNQHIFWQRRKDHFLLERNNPSFYENYHLTDVYGSQLNFTYPGRIFIHNAGIDLRSENIFSNNIGYEITRPRKVQGTDSSFYTRQYQRTNFSLFAEEVFTPGNWDITAGVMLNMNTGFPEKVTVFPGLEIGYHTDNGLITFININRALHLPTFTDLFYTDPLNRGNINLEPNKILSFEGGIKYSGNNLNSQLSLFYNSGRDIIDWLWDYETNRFSPVNIDNYKVRGLSSTVNANLSKNRITKHWLDQVSLNYIYLSIDKSSDTEVSKYYNLKHKLSAALTQKFVSNLFLTWRISYQDRYGEAITYEEPTGYVSVPYRPYWLVDGIIKWKLKHLEIFSEVSNILNTKYIDAGSVYQPGRWFKVGLSLMSNN